jgi:hypothetical protein
MMGLQQLRYIQFPKLWRFYSLTLPLKLESECFEVSTCHLRILVDPVPMPL